MAKQKEAWDKLSMQEKAQLIKLSVDNGVSSLKQIRDTYNLYSSGGKKQSAVNRPRDIDEAIEISRNTPYNKNIDDVEGPGYREYMWKLAQAKSKVWGISPEEAYDSFIHPSEFNYRRWYNLASQDELDNTLTNGDAHWMDVFGKTVGADTFSNESPYSGYVNPYNPKGITGGTWTGRLGIDEYIPSESQIDNNWPLNKAWFAIDRGNKYYQEKISKGEDTHEVPSIMTYNNGVMLPEITVTPRGNYIEYSPYANGGDLAHKKSGEEQGESSYIQKQDNTNIYSLPIIDPVPVPDEMRLSDEKLVALNHAKALYANEGLEIVSPEFDLLTLARGFMTEPLRIIKGKNAAKKPLAIGAEDFTYGTKDNINKYFDNAVKSEATQLLENPRYRGLLEWPYEDIAIYRNLPDEVLDIYSEGVIPRMVEQRPWLNADDFIRDTENALLYRSPGYAVYPDKVFVKAGLDDVAGMYFPSTGQISIAEGYVQKALPHEIRHKLDDAIDLTLSENNYLQNAYGNIFSDMKGFKTSDMAKEMVTTNLDSRLKLLGRHSTSDIKIQNALIDRASDDLIFKAVEQSNSYGKKFIELLKEQGLLTPERAQYFRDAMKYVGMFSAPMVLATTTDNQKSTGGPLYPFSFEKKSFLKTPVVRYDEGGFFARLFGKKDTPPTLEEIKAARVERFVNDTWETEYSIPRGYDPTTGLFYPYKSPEGGTKTIGPGFKLRADGSGDATMFSAKEAAKGVTREQINEKLRAQGELQYDKVLEFLNQKGNRLPIDTINPNIMNGLMDLRFQVGALGGWDNLREAVLNGDLESIKKESLVTFKDGDTGKIKPDVRRNELRAKKFWHYD